MEIEARDSGGYWSGSLVGSSGDSVCRPPLSVMKANQLGWQRRVPQEESQCAGPNEPGLEIREVERKERQIEQCKTNELISREESAEGKQERKTKMEGMLRNKNTDVVRIEKREDGFCPQNRVNKKREGKGSSG